MEEETRLWLHRGIGGWLPNGHFWDAPMRKQKVHIWIGRAPIKCSPRPSERERENKREQEWMLKETKKKHKNLRDKNVNGIDESLDEKEKANRNRLRVWGDRERDREIISEALCSTCAPLPGPDGSDLSEWYWIFFFTLAFSFFLFFLIHKWNSFCTSL